MAILGYDSATPNTKRRAQGARPQRRLLVLGAGGAALVSAGLVSAPKTLPPWILSNGVIIPKTERVVIEQPMRNISCQAVFEWYWDIGGQGNRTTHPFIQNVTVLERNATYVRFRVEDRVPVLRNATPGSPGARLSFPVVVDGTFTLVENSTARTVVHVTGATPPLSWVEHVVTFTPTPAAGAGGCGGCLLREDASFTAPRGLAGYSAAQGAAAHRTSFKGMAEWLEAQYGASCQP